MDIRAISANGGRSSSAARVLDQVNRYKRLLGAYWWILCITTGLSLGVGWMLLQHKPKSFFSIGRMTLNMKLSIPNAGFYSEDPINFFGTQVEYMESATVQARVYQRLRAQGSTLHPVPVEFQVGVTPKANIFNLRAEGSDPDYVHAYLEATMDEYIKFKRELLENTSSVTTSGLEKARDLMGAQLQESKQALFNFQASNSVVFLQKSGGNDAADYLAELNRQLTQRKSELQLLETLTLDENLERQQGVFSPPSSAAQIVAPRRNGRPNSTNANEAGVTNALDNQAVDNADGFEYRLANAPGGAVGFEASYLQAKQQIVMLKAHRAELSQNMRPKHPEIVALDEEIGRQQRLLQVFADQSREQLRNHQHVVEAQIKDLQEQVKVWEAKAVEASKTLSEFDALKANCSRLQGLCDQLQGTLQTVDLNKGIGQETVSVLEPATPAYPSPRNALAFMTASGLFGLVIGFGILLVRSQLDDRPASVMELEQLLGQSVLGQIPLLKVKDSKKEVPLIQMDDDRHMLVESYSNLRSALLYKDSPVGRQSKSIVVTSAAPGDGKSMVCANLAISLAQTGMRVLLVDADLRRGQLHKRFDIPSHPGLAEVLGQKCDWSKAVAHTSIPNLDLLPCGEPPQRPASLLISSTKKLLEEMAGHYDYYLFDSAPVLAADDVSSLAPQVDGVLMVIRAGSTYGRFAKSALDLLHLRKVNVIGLVFNGVNPKTKEYGYYRYNDYFTEAPARSNGAR